MQSYDANKLMIVGVLAIIVAAVGASGVREPQLGGFVVAGIVAIGGASLIIAGAFIAGAQQQRDRS